MFRARLCQYTLKYQCGISLQLILGCCFTVPMVTSEGHCDLWGMWWHLRDVVTYGWLREGPSPSCFPRHFCTNKIIICGYVTDAGKALLEWKATAVWCLNTVLVSEAEGTVCALKVRENFREAGQKGSVSSKSHLSSPHAASYVHKDL